MAHYETYADALEAAREQITRAYAASPETYPDTETMNQLIAEKARELFGDFEAEPRGGWRIERRHVRVLIDPDGGEHFDGDLLTVSQIAELRGVSKRRVQQWGARIGLTRLGSMYVTTVSDALGFRPQPVGQPRKV